MQGGNLAAILTYAQFEETLSITLSGPPAATGIRMKGVSFRDLKGEGRDFILDTFTGELSPDGRQIRGSAVDAQGSRSRWEFARIK